MEINFIKPGKVVATFVHQSVHSIQSTSKSVPSTPRSVRLEFSFGFHDGRGEDEATEDAATEHAMTGRAKRITACWSMGILWELENIWPMDANGSYSYITVFFLITGGQYIGFIAVNSGE